MKLKSKFIISIIFVFGIVLGGIYCANSRTVNAAYESYEINSIDENRYPGFKAQLNAVKSAHPNWKIKLLYTGLDWNSVINSEYTGHGEVPKSLIYDTYDGEWMCPICGATKYDVSKRWYCASKEAIAYMMDPRNSFTDGYIFQFQDLSSTVGDYKDIEQMTNGTFLGNAASINAIMIASTQHTVSPFHIASRILQEQGNDGSGIMNGYRYKNTIIYNLFNINVSGNKSQQGYENGADFAYNEKWFTREQSIIGGTKFLREKYINLGQNTLYFQKFNVVQAGNLYNHQYMQNIRAANDEGNRMYNTYVAKSLLNANFEFCIPIYENMPATAVKRPLTSKDAYVGNINSELQSISLDNVYNPNYISGQIVIVEWKNGQSTVPSTLPRMTIESTDGTVRQEMFVKYLSGNLYYYDRNIAGLDKSKQYYICAELTEPSNISSNKKSTVRLTNQRLGFTDDIEIIIDNSIIKYQYYGKMTGRLNKLTLNKINNKYYFCGEIYATEIVNDKEKGLPTVPRLVLTSTDGTVRNYAFVKRQNSPINTYYFDIIIDDFNKEKLYSMRLESTTNYNLSNQKNMILDISKTEENYGKYSDYIIYRMNNTIAFLKGGYVGDINSELKKLSLNKNSNGSYISGEIVVVEWVDGKSTVPSKTPIMKMKSIDGKITLDIFVTATGTNTYYFDRFIEGIDTEKEYVIEISSGNNVNISKNKTMNVYFINEFKDKTLGIYGSKKMITKNNRLSFIENIYIGDINSELKKLTLNKNSNSSYISGEIVVVEWIDGKSTVPSKTPIMKMKSTDGKVSLDIFVTATGTNTYYFDRFIDGIDMSKDYVIEISSGNSNNISANKVMNLYFVDEFKNKILGQYNSKQILLEDNKIKFK